MCKTWRFLLGLAAVLSCLVLPSKASNLTEDVDGLTWSYSVTNGEATVTGAPNSGVWTRNGEATGTLVVPKTLGGCPVTKLGRSAFLYCTAASVVLPDGLTTVGEGCFYDARDLVSINFPSTLKRLEFMAFFSTSKLAGVLELPAGIEYIGNAVFACCEAITEIRIPATNKYYKNIGSAIYTADGKTLLRGPSTGDFIVPAACEEFATQACLDSRLTSISFCKPVKLGWRSLASSGVKTLIYPKGTTVVDVGDFYTGTAVAIPKSVVSISGSRGWLTSFQTVYCEEGDEARVRDLVYEGAENVSAFLDKISFVSFVWPEVPTTPQEIQQKTDAELEAWAGQYPAFAEKFGSDIRAAVKNETVWKSLAAGTDPTDAAQTFKATLAFVDGRPKLSWEPQLSAAETEKREYTLFGKRTLSAEHWDRIQPGEEAEYNFFTVQVRLK